MSYDFADLSLGIWGIILFLLELLTMLTGFSLGKNVQRSVSLQVIIR